MEFVLGKYGKGLVNLALAESFFEKGGDNYEVAMLANKGRMQAEAGGKIEQCFVGDGMLAWLHIITGKVKEAEELLTRFKGKAQQENAERILPNIDTFLVRCALYDADKAAIAKWLAQAPDEELIFSIYDRFHYITKVRVYLQNGRNEQAYHLLLKCAYYAKVMQRTTWRGTDKSRRISFCTDHHKRRCGYPASASGNILEAVGSRKRSGTDQKEQTVLGKGSGRDRKNGTILSGVFKSGCGRSHIE